MPRVKKVKEAVKRVVRKEKPRVIEGICEFCGVKAEECKHYKK